VLLIEVVDFKMVAHRNDFGLARLEHQNKEEKTPSVRPAEPPVLLPALPQDVAG
jgi:hypothetical protein